MYHLIYVSQAAQPMREDELADILAHSRNYNSANDVTGLLIYRFAPDSGRGNFMQLLEGEREEVRNLFERICADPRHHTKILLEEGESGGRHFPDWSMGFRDVDTADLADHPGFADLGEETFRRRAAHGEIEGALDLMRSFYEE